MYANRYPRLSMVMMSNTADYHKGGSETTTLCSIICFTASDNSKLIISYYLCGKIKIKIADATSLNDDLNPQRCSG